MQEGVTQLQALVTDLPTHATAYYYTCASEILAGRGQMYMSDDRLNRPSIPTHPPPSNMSPKPSKHIARNKKGRATALPFLLGAVVLNGFEKSS